MPWEVTTVDELYRMLNDEFFCWDSLGVSSRINLNNSFNCWHIGVNVPWTEIQFVPALKE